MADDRSTRSRNDRIEAMLQRIADALGIPVEAFFDDAVAGPPSEGTGCSDADAPIRLGLERERQAAGMRAMFDCVSDPADREACLAFVRARAGL